jgi:dTDP-6-deoxy-L-talose 4-dehydrogenase (NAD+)
VTGANGYIGRHVVSRLLDSDNLDIVAVGLTTERVDTRAQRLDIDIFDSNINLFEITGKPDICLHLAWEDGFSHNSKSHMSKLSDHFRFCTDLIDSGITQLAVMGSMHEIGYHIGAIDENTPCKPISQYGIAKDALRRSLFNYVDNRLVVFQWLRAFYIYGDDIANHSIFTKLIDATQRGRKTFPFTSGTNRYDFIDIKELAEQIACCLLQQDIRGIINCCSGQPVSLASKVEDFIAANGFDIKLDYGAFPDREYDSPEVWGDDTKIKQVLFLAKRAAPNV